MNRMETIPKNYEEHSENLMTNFDHSIDNEVAQELKKDELWAQYTGWNFWAGVWWNRQRKEWSCMVKHYWVHVDTFHAATLENIMNIVSEIYGND